MSRTIDEKVVEMRFDNKNFESNVQTSLGTLEKLKQSLKFPDATKGFEEIDRAAGKVDLNPMSNGIEAVKLKFSALEVMAVTALSNITNSAINAGKNLVSSLTIDQVTAGWNKYEQKTSSVQTIMNATGKSIDEVNGYLDKLMWYSDETSYGFTDMTQSLGQLTSAGGDIENLIPMIEGIANATAFAGKGATEFSRAIYNLNQSYSAGHLQYMDWRSLELAGVASKQLKQVFIETAEAMGKIAKGEINIANFSETLKDKWADTEVMEAAFGKFAKVTEAAYEIVEDGSNKIDTATVAYKVLSGELDETSEEYKSMSEAHKALVGTFSDVEIAAAKSAQEAKTFSEAIEATKDAVSSGWMKTSEIIFGNYEEAKKVWSELTEGLWDVFASGGEKRNELLAEAFGSKWEQFASKIEDAGISVDSFQSKLSETLSEQGKSLDDIISEYGSLDKAIRAGAISTNNIIHTIKKFSGAVDESSKSTENVTDKLEYFQKVVDQVWRGDFGNGADRINKLTKAGYDYAAVQDLVNKTVDGHRLTLDDLSDAQLASIGYTEEEIEALRELGKQAGKSGSDLRELIDDLKRPTGRELFIDSFRNILGSIATIIETIKSAWGEIFEITPDGLYDAIDAFHKFSEAMVINEYAAEKLKSAFKGVFAILDVVATIAGSVLKNAFRVLGALFSATSGDVLDLTASVGDNIVAFRNWFKEHNIVAKALDKLGDILVSGIKKVKAWINAFEKSETLKKIISGISNALNSGVQKVRDWVNAFNNVPIVRDAVAKVYDALTRLKEVLFDISASKIITFIGNCIAKIKEWVKAFLELPKVQKAIENVKTTFKDVYEGIKEYFGEGAEKIIEFIDRCKELDGISLENAKQVFKDFYDNVFKYFFDTEAIKKNISKLVSSLVDGFWELDEKAIGMKKAFKSFKWNIGGGIFDAGGKLEWVKTKFLELADVAEEKLPSLMGLASAAVLIKNLDKIGNALKLLADPIKAIVNACAGAVKALQTFVKGIVFKLKAKGILDIALAIAALAGSLWLIAQIPSDKLLKAVLAIGALFAMLGGLSVAISKLGSMQNLKDVKDLAIASLSFLSLAGALIVLAGALKLMEKLDFVTALGNAALLAGLAVALGVAIGLLNKLSGGAKKAAASALTFVGMAVAVKILADVLVELDGIPFDNIWASLGKMLSIVGLLAALALACSFVKFGTGLGVIGIVLSLKLLMMTFDDIEKIDLDKVKDNLDKFKMVFGILAGLMLAMRFAGENAGKAGIGVIAMSAGILLLVKAIKDIASIKDSDIDKGVTAISRLLFMFGIITVLSKFAGEHAAKAGRAMVTASVGILILAGAIHLLKDVDEAAIRKATNAISQLLLMFAVLIASTKNIPEESVASLIALEVGVVALVACIALLSGLDAGAVKRSTACLSIVMGMFALLIASTKMINTEGKAWLKTVGVLATLTLVVGALAYILKMISGLPVESTLSNAAGLSMLLLAISASLVIIGIVKDVSNDAIFALGAMTIVVGMLALVLTMMNEMQVENAIPNAMALSALIVALSAACVLLGKVPVTGINAGLVALGEVALVIIAVVGIASLLNEYCTDIRDAMAGGFDLLKQFAAGLGEIIGAFIGGIGNGFMEQAIALSQKFIEFGDGIQEFADGVSSIDASSVEGFSSLCEAILAINVAALINMFTGQSLEDFGTQLKSFGEALTGYSTTVSADGAINQEAIDASITAANKLVDLAHTVPSSGLIPWIVGQKNLGTFGTQLANFGTAIVGYSTAVSADGAINQEAIGASITAADKLVALAQTVPTSGLIPWITGEQNLGAFGTQLALFGAGICAYSSAVSSVGINQEAIASSVTAAEKLVELAKTLPESGLIQKLAGEQNLGTFGNQLATFGGSIASYGEKVANIDTQAVGTSIVAANRLVTLAKKVSDTDVDSGKISDFVDTIEDIGDSIGSMSESVGSGGQESITVAVNAVDSMIDIVNKISTVDTSNIANFKMALQELATIDLQNFANQFGNAGEQSTINLSSGLTNGIPTIRGAVMGLISGANQEVSSGIPQFTNSGVNMVYGLGAGIGLGKPTVISSAGIVISDTIQRIGSSMGQFFSSGANSMSNLSNGIKGGTGSVVGSTSNVIGSSIQSILSKGGLFNSSGISSMENFGGGILAQLSGVSESASSVADGAISSLNGKVPEFNSIGGFMMEGLKGGILDKAASIAEAAVNAVKGAIDAAKNALGIASPSKVFAEMGRFTDKGYINGIVELMPKVAAAAKSMASKAIDGASAIVSNVGSIPLDGTEFVPTIRPVVDMSSVRPERINLGANLDVSMIRPINSLSQIVSDAQSEINASNQKVIDAVNGLREDIITLYNAVDGKETALYVDSKKLASSLSRSMNRELNILSKRGSY